MESLISQHQQQGSHVEQVRKSHVAIRIPVKPGEPLGLSDTNSRCFQVELAVKGVQKASGLGLAGSEF